MGLKFNVNVIVMDMMGTIIIVMSKLITGFWGKTRQSSLPEYTTDTSLTISGDQAKFYFCCLNLEAKQTLPGFIEESPWLLNTVVIGRCDCVHK